MINVAFLPDPELARALDARMNREFGLSLSHVCEQSRGELTFDEPQIQKLIDHALNGGRIRPGVFAKYYNLVQAIYNQDKTSAEKLFEEIAAAEPMPNGFEIVALGDSALGSETDLYLQKWHENQTQELGFTVPTEETTAAFKKRLALGLKLVEDALPELYGEISAIIHQIVISDSNPNLKYQFDGGSHYQLWGALFLNGQFHPDRVAVVEVLAHECAHSLLFGFCTHQGLVDNDETDLFKSPLRADPRPMDGIYHATFVSARMHWAMTQLAKSPHLTSEERDRALAAAKADQSNFQAGYGVVAEHALVTELGGSLMDGAKKYMDAAATA